MEIRPTYAAERLFGRSSLRQVYFEAVANAFDAGADRIEIVTTTDNTAVSEALTVTVEDNGEGFTDHRFGCFRRIQEPEDAYHQGVGRLVYMQYFERVAVESCYDGKKRSFVFSDAFRGESEVVSNASLSNGGRTKLSFSGFRKDRVRAVEDFAPEPLKEAILEHFLPLLHSRRKAGTDFSIAIKLDVASLGQDDLLPRETTLTQDDLPEFSEKDIPSPGLDLFDDVNPIRMSWVILEAGSRSRVFTAVSVDERTVPIKLIENNAVPVGYSATFLFDSPVFVGRSDSSRQELRLPESIPEGTLRSVLRREVGAVLAGELPEIERHNDKVRADVEEHYPHLVGLFDANTVGLVARDDAIESAQRRFFKEQKAVLEADSLDDDVFRKSLELSSRSLTEYVLFREVTIERLRELSTGDPEATAHSLIVPRFQTFRADDVSGDVYRHNAWLLDDKFMSFTTVLSDRPLKEAIQAIRLDDEQSAGLTGRPDVVMIFSADPEGGQPVEVVVVELKKRQVDDKENSNVKTQLLRRAEKLADHYKNIERVWYFGVIEIDDSYARLLRSDEWKPLFSRGRHLYYRELPVERSDGEVVPTPMYLLSYDAIIEDAAARNQTFLKILKAEIARASLRSAQGVSSP